MTIYLPQLLTPTCRSRKFDPVGFALRGRIRPSSNAMFAIIYLVGTFIADLLKSK